MSEVYINRIKTNKIEKEIKAVLTGIGYLPKKRKIFIKPNIVGFCKPGSPYIVNPRIVGALIEYLKDNGYQDILIGELPVPRDTNGIFAVTGYKLLSQKYNVKLTDFNSFNRVQVNCGEFNIGLPEFLLANEREYINVAKMKTHIQTTVSLCTKNQKGLVDFSGRRMMHTKGDLHANIKSLARIVKPDFCVIDGINALEGDGPGMGGLEIKDFNILVLGESMETVDWVGAQLMGIDPAKVRHLLMPSETIKIVGEDVARAKKQFILPKGHIQMFNIHYWFTDKTCSGCSEVMGELKRSLIKSPARLLRFLCQTFIGRIDFLTGDVDFPQRHGKIICLGNCMEEKARLNNLSIAKGCPPDSSEVLPLL